MTKDVKCIENYRQIGENVSNYTTFQPKTVIWF